MEKYLLLSIEHDVKDPDHRSGLCCLAEWGFQHENLFQPDNRLQEIKGGRKMYQEVNMKIETIMDQLHALRGHL